MNSKMISGYKTDRLYKLNPLIRLLSKSFEKVTPRENVVIDESLVLFHGRTILRQYISNKSHRYGLKIYKLCSVDGYTWRFILYKSKGETVPGLSHFESIIMALMKGLFKKGRTLYINNFYSSVETATNLIAKAAYRIADKVLGQILIFHLMDV